MISSQDSSNTITLKERMAAFQVKMEAAKKEITPQLLEFFVTLGMEGERSSVVLGAERINVALEILIKSSLQPSSNKTDTLFTSEGALASFSRKIEMAYRLGLIDLPFKQALDLVRKLRNDFAHAIKVESLQQDSHADRVKALSKLVIKGNEKAIEGFALAYKKAAQEVQAQVPPEQVRAYLSCVMLLLLKLELTRHFVQRPDVLLPAKINYKDD
jgi:hypothetical protein